MGETTGELVEIDAARRNLDEDLTALGKRVRGEARSQIAFWKRPVIVIAAAAIVGLFLLGFTAGRITKS
jgi:hypothetical protein